VHAVEQLIFRGNPHYELVLVDRLTDGERQVLGDVVDDDLYGILRPSYDCGLQLRSCSLDTALLFLTLVKPGPLPAFARRALGADVDRVVARLVVDGVLEVATDDGYRSGPAAAGLVVPPGPSGGGLGRIADLSTAALRYGEALGDLPTEVLAGRLYSYGRRAVSPELRRRMPDVLAVDVFAGIALDGPVARTLAAAGWSLRPEGARSRPAPWRCWAAPGFDRAGSGRPRADEAQYKLYVSPVLDAMPETLTTLAGVLVTSPGVRGFKVARDLVGLCRPDKIVVYVNCLDDLRHGVSRIVEQLAGTGAHGVPFTAAATLDGLVSWGVDPPSKWAAPTSWRLWVVERLAEYLGAAVRSADPREIEPLRFALDRLRLAGVNTDTWMPTSSIWRDAWDVR
jgi:hypothetical protein